MGTVTGVVVGGLDAAKLGKNRGLLMWDIVYTLYIHGYVISEYPFLGLQVH